MTAKAKAPKTPKPVVQLVGVDAPPMGVWVTYKRKHFWLNAPAAIVGCWNITEAEVDAAYRALPKKRARR